MKRNLILAVAVSTLASALELAPVVTVHAGNSSENLFFSEDNNERYDEISPRFTYIQSVDIGVYPSATEVTYNMYIRGISEVTGVSGTMTLYKQNAQGNYEEKESTKVDLSGSKIRCSGSFKSYGAGEYKLEFSGTVYAKSGSEPVTFQNFNSY